jgi:cytochrome c peroxidase
LVAASACQSTARHAPAQDAQRSAAPWEQQNPTVPLPRAPLGTEIDFGHEPWVTPAKARLGRWLFFDKRLSGDGSVSCASCHDPEHALADTAPHSKGARGGVTPRKSPTLLNVAWWPGATYTWDGHEPTLQAQIKGALANPVTMGNTHENAVRVISGIGGYRRAFGEAWADDRVDIDRIAEAIAAYEATRVSGNSAYDRFAAGDAQALDAEAKRGRDLFFGRAQCATCHSGWDFTDSSFHNLGVGWRPVAGATRDGFADVGHSKVSGRAEDTGAFKTPSLRSVGQRAPYMHDGSMQTLREVVEHYNRGGTGNPWLSDQVHPLGLSADEVAALVSFLESLWGDEGAERGPAVFPE